jgi:nucleoside-diphosphate-sugar epimerase
MKALFIGGTGNISSAISEQLLRQGCELWLLNRGNRKGAVPEGCHVLTGDIRDEAAVKKLISGHRFDVVADFIAYQPEDAERGWRLFHGCTKQFIFISSASAYQKPSRNYLITESTPLINPYSAYARGKAACEAALMEHHREDGFPVTIVRPSHTYGQYRIPLALQGKNGAWQTLKRMLEGKPVPIHGDGSSLWTLTHTRDFAKGFTGLMGNTHAIGQAVHITGDESLTWTQIHELIAGALGVRLNPLYVPSDLLAKAGNAYGYDFGAALMGDKMVSVVFDNTKLKRLVPGFAATTRFDQGILESVEYALAHESAQTEDPDYEAFCNQMAHTMWNAHEQPAAEGFPIA